MSVMFVYGSRHLFAPRRLTLKDQSKQNPGSASGPTSSGSLALSLIRGSLQRAILGPVQLARRPASHPPDQCQSSAVTYVALCVASAIAIKKRFFNYRATLRVACRSGRSASSFWRFASHNGFAMSVMFVYGSRHLFAPRRVTLKDQSNQNPGSVSGPTSSGSLALSLIRGSLQRAILGPVQLARRPASHPPDQRQSSAVTYVALCVVSAIAVKKRFLSTIVRRSASHAVLDALRPLCGASRHKTVLRCQ
ncbi:hypothetical protein PSCFBP3800_02058 [Pseudomonas syringae group genomosp. 3]|uniref:Uncharacterized protein n=1 Tax=Pseudomonas syringae group genomosp. 3 TaxID=251701 RepID=A0A2K4WBH8_9PSED|nr:hypothetical protein CFBP6411_01889 [Pseudomonas syringae group genomosp. 3]SPF12093.1 hypothetical protein PSCFBP3800_02058 [Pseudomonas syringae group genomosp. 3]